MTTNISAQPCSLTINGIERKQNLISFAISSNELSDSGIIQTGSITLKANYNEILDFTYLASPAIGANWARGAEVIFKIADKNYGVFYILKEPDPPDPQDYQIQIQIGDIAALLNYRSANIDVSGITAGVATARNTVIERYLARAGASYSISSIPYPFYFPQPKANQESFVETAAKMARASNHVLYVDRSGVIRNKAIALTGTAIATFTIGEDEQLFEPSDAVEVPVDVLTIAGLSTQVKNSAFSATSTTEDYNSQNFIYINPQLGIDPVQRNLRYLQKRTTVTDYGWDGVQEKVEIFIESSNLLQEAIYLLESNPVALLCPTSLQINTKKYDAKHRLIEELQENYIWVSTINFLAFQSNPQSVAAPQSDGTFQSRLALTKYNDTDIKITYQYSNLDQIISKRTETTNYYNLFNLSGGTTGSVIYGRVAKEESWTNNTYAISNYYQDTDLIANRDGTYQLRLQNNWFNASSTIVYARDSSTDPPATTYRKPYEPIETPITAKIKAISFAGDSYKERSRPVDVDFLETVQQAAEYGQTYLALLYGRRYGFSFGTAINSNLLSNLTPLSRIDIIWRGVIYECLADAIAFKATLTEMIIGFNLIVLRTALVATPSTKSETVTPSIEIDAIFYEEPTGNCLLTTDLYLGAVFYEEPFGICTLSTGFAIEVIFYEEPTATCTLSTVFSWSTLTADDWANITPQGWADLTP